MAPQKSSQCALRNADRAWPLPPLPPLAKVLLSPKSPTPAAPRCRAPRNASTPLPLSSRPPARRAARASRRSAPSPRHARPHPLPTRRRRGRHASSPRLSGPSPPARPEPGAGRRECAILIASLTVTFGIAPSAGIGTASGSKLRSDQATSKASTRAFPSSIAMSQASANCGSLRRRRQIASSENPAAAAARLTFPLVPSSIRNRSSAALLHRPDPTRIILAPPACAAPHPCWRSAPSGTTAPPDIRPAQCPRPPRTQAPACAAPAHWSGPPPPPPPKPSHSRSARARPKRVRSNDGSMFRCWHITSPVIPAEAGIPAFRFAPLLTYLVPVGQEFLTWFAAFDQWRLRGADAPLTGDNPQPLLPLRCRKSAPVWSRRNRACPAGDKSIRPCASGCP